LALIVVTLMIMLLQTTMISVLNHTDGFLNVMVKCPSGHFYNFDSIPPNTKINKFIWRAGSERALIIFINGKIYTLDEYWYPTNHTNITINGSSILKEDIK
jgi:hypothetical protein